MLASEVFSRIRFHLNDPTSTYFTDAVLMEPVNVALDDLRGELIDNNVPITNTVSSLLAINPNVVEISASTTPPLPTGLVEIQDIQERGFGTAETFMEMKRMEFLPEIPSQSTSLIYWTWQEEKIRFTPANSKRDIKINYIKTTLPDIISPASTIDMIRAKPFLAYRAAALAAENLGEDLERAASLNNNAGRELDKLINLSVKGKQVMPVRRRPFISGSYSRG